MTSQPRPPATVVADGVEDLINTLPALFGFRPAESVVAIATYGANHRFGFRLRFDLPPRDGIDLAARTVEHHLRMHRADGAVIVILTDHQALARDLNVAITAALGTIEPIVVARANEQLFWVDMPDVPEQGVAYKTSDNHVAVVAAIAAGQQILADRGSVEQLYAPVGGRRREEMTELFVTVQRQLERDQLLSAAAAESHLAEIVKSVEQHTRLDDTAVVQLCVWLADPACCQSVWSRITTENVATWRDAMAHVSRLVVAPFEPSVLALAAFAAWASGDGTRALIAATRAHQADTSHEFATLMLAIVQRGVPPHFWRTDMGH